MFKFIAILISLFTLTNEQYSERARPLDAVEAVSLVLAKEKEDKSSSSQRDENSLSQENEIIFMLHHEIIIRDENNFPEGDISPDHNEHIDFDHEEDYFHDIDLGIMLGLSLNFLMHRAV
jgi:hypothetical protein